MAVQRGPTFFPTRINMRVASMQAVGAVLPYPGADLRVEFLAPAAPSNSAIAASQSATAALTLTLGSATALTVDANSPYGRNVRVYTVTAATFVVTQTVSVSGVDYLNNPMTETISFGSATADATAAEGIKAFKTVNYAAVTAATATPTAEIISLGFGSKLGLPYRNVGIVGTKTYKRPRGATSGDSWDAVATATGQVLVALGATVTPTATTADNRGTYAPTASCDGTADFAVEYQIDQVNAHGATQA